VLGKSNTGKPQQWVKITFGLSKSSQRLGIHAVVMHMITATKKMRKQLPEAEPSDMEKK